MKVTSENLGQDSSLMNLLLEVAKMVVETNCFLIQIQIFRCSKLEFNVRKCYI